MKRKIIILTLIFVFAGSVALGLTFVNLTPDEALESAVENNAQFEINELNLELNQITHDKNLKTASLPTLNNYYGQLSKYYNPFNSETTLTVKEAQNQLAYGQLEIDVTAAAIALETSALSYDEADMNYSEAKAAYYEAVNDSDSSTSDKMTLKYAMDSALISLHQAENNLESAQRKLDDLVGIDGSFILLPTDYSNPYDLDPETVYLSALEADINIYQSMRKAEAASIKLDIAGKFYDEDEETYISALAGLKSAELSYDKAIRALEASVHDDIDNLKNKFDSIELAKLNKQIKLNDYNAAKSQFDAGIISSSSLKNAESAYTGAVKQLDAKIHDYILASMRFTLNYGYEF